jgi:putative ABC transport system permease protein
MSHWLLRAVERLVPAEWRPAIARDLEEEARTEHRSRAWLAWQAARVAVRMRWTLQGGAVMVDLRYAVRSLLGARWFTAGAILTFALGIGFNVAVFSAVDRVLFRPLPYAHPESLVLLRSCDRTTGDCKTGSFPAAVGLQLTQGSSTMERLAVAGDSEMVTPTRGVTSEESRLWFVDVSPRTLRTLGVSPASGRDISDEEIEGKQRVVWISDEVWRSRFGADPGVIGATFRVGNTPVPVLGILPRGFIPPTWSSPNPDWAGLIVEYGGWTGFGPTGRTLVPFARLKPGATLAAAQAELEAVGHAVGGDPRRPNAPPEYLRVDRLEASLFSHYQSYLWLVVVAAGLVLLMACANLASLFLARGRSREQLAAICTAMGASPGRLMTTAVIESALVCLAGAATAIVALAAAQKGLALLLPPIFNRYAAGLTDVRVVGFSLAATVACALVAGVLPGWRLMKVDVLPLLQKGSRSGRRARVRGGRGLLVFEAALGSMLVLGAVLAVRSFIALTRDDLGFQPEGLYLASGGAGTPPADPAQRFEYQRAGIRQVVEVLRQMPGVLAAGAGDYVPTAREAPVRAFSKNVRGDRVQVSPGYFEALGMRLLAGRAFREDDLATHAEVAMMNRLGARLLWPDLTPAQTIGRVWQPTGETPRVVVGVVDVVKGAYGGREPQPTAYLPMGAEPTPWRWMVLKAKPDQPLQIQAMQSFLQSRLPEGRISGLTYVPDSLDPGLRDPRFRAVLLTAFALTGLLLACVGLYAVASYDAALRRYEMGVRLALGAAPADLRRLVLRETCWPVAAGAMIGLVGAWWTARFAQSFLFQTDGRDPVFYLVVVGVLIGTAVTAGWLPARRASATNPAIVLRAQ